MHPFSRSSSHPVRYLLIALACAASLRMSGGAQEAEVTALSEVVVTGTTEDSLTVPTLEEARAEVAQIPGGASVIDAETYKRGRATTIKDALDFAPGVFVQPRFGAE